VTHPFNTFCFLLIVENLRRQAMKVTGCTTSYLPITILVIVGVLVWVLNSGSIATAGVYADSAHGNTSYGVHRSGAGYATGDCAPCHETVDPAAATCGDNNFMLFYDDWVSQDDLLCIGCHSDSVDPQQVYNDTYSVNFGGETSAPEYDTVKEQFNDGTAEHDLSAIRDLIGNDAYGWGFGSDPDPCVACHAPHTAQRSVPVIIEEEKLNTAIRRPSHYMSASPADARWGDDAGERMSDYVAQLSNGVYQAPYYGVHPSGVYEPSGNASPDDGSDMPDYVTFCLDCHQDAIGSVAAVDWDNVAHGGSAGYGVTGFLPPYIDGTPNYVLSCLDCHEPHGGPGPTRQGRGLIRGWVNGKLTYPSLNGSDYDRFCQACHSESSSMGWCQTCHCGELGLGDTAHDPCAW
jgi:hypothetical protein